MHCTTFRQPAALTVLAAVVAVLGCATPATPPPSGVRASLKNTTWQLRQLGTKEIVVRTGAAVPNLSLADDGAFSSFNGCNRLVGRYMLEGDQLSFAPIASTRMLCPDIGGADAAFDAMLSKTSGWRISGDTLELLSDGAPLARLQAARQ
jgi:heat shock protein HslJ